ncbi:Zn-dependent protease with chaperone function [Mesonia algae]|uniref:Zn-dependent protease with chaperone function n=1 Tax=Mesonia algae TaxID=213248 RepID=A0A2W7I756_9FLAO|nr:M48 family metallopeptidase [Mesonia algae]PZW42736.1 Zn-dependent protease with chaperone function [Mesonia algae]
MREIKVSPEFKTQTAKAITSIGLFLLVYILMLSLAVGLTLLCIYGAGMLIEAFPKFITLALGIGLISLGVLVLFFLLKFIFKSHKVDRSHLTEIKITDEPQLFELIDEIVIKVGTSFPKKVYLSNDVNAAVFYNSSFWSMFFPIKKNLQIGLGLVNTVSESELTAILSHEFGHFSQKTMKVGSYVYYVNQVIYNLLYDNESYDNLIQKWANASSYFSFFGIIAIKIIEGIKWVLKQMYEVVNKSYLALSREMEFHADEIAANVTGYEPLKSSLLRLSLADHSFGSVLSFYEKKVSNHLKAENIFKDQIFAMNFLAKESDLSIKNYFPQVSVQELNKFNKSKLVIKDQWASHPSTEDRIAMLEKTGLTAKGINNQPANLIFSDIEKTQKEFTEKMFKEVVYEGEVSTMTEEAFQQEFKNEFLENSFPSLYNDYYDNKNPLLFDLQKIDNDVKNIQLADLFSEDKIDMVYTSIALENDIETIKQISDKKIKLKTFDYDGVKYSQINSKKLLRQLKIEQEELNEQIRFNDIKIFMFFKACEKESKSEHQLEGLYTQFFDYDKNFDSKYEVYTVLSDALQFINYTTPIEQIESNLIGVKKIEKQLKSEIHILLDNDLYQAAMSKEIKDNFDLYLSRDWKYFGNERYYDDHLETLFTAMSNYAFLLSQRYFLLKKHLLNYQAQLIQITSIIQHVQNTTF